MTNMWCYNCEKVCSWFANLAAYEKSGAKKGYAQFRKMRMYVFP